jgi:hypothetical protein
VVAEAILFSSMGKGFELVQVPQWHPLKIDVYVAGEPFVALEKPAVEMVKPNPLMVAHSSREESYSFIWKSYKPPSRAVTSVAEHVD